MESNKRQFIEKYYPEFIYVLEKNGVSVEQIEKELLEAIEKDDGWIEIKEGCEMPENHQQILIYTEPVIGNAVYTNRNGHGLEFLNLGYHFANTQPTHWRELPKPPQS